MLFSKDKLNCFFLQLSSVLFAVLLSFSQELDVDIITYLKVLVLTQYIISTYSNFIINRWIYNAYGIFLSLFFVFILSRVLLDLIGYSDFGQTSFFSSYIFDNSIQIKMLWTIYISLVSLNIGFLLNKKLSKYYIGSYSEASQGEAYFGKLLVYIGFLPTLLKSLYLGYLVARYGYLTIFLNPDLFRLPLIVSFLSMLFPIGFFLCHIGGISDRRFMLFINVLFFISIISEVFIGKRGPVLTQLLVLLWFFTYHYGTRISIKKLLIYAFIMILGSQMALNFRTSGNKETPNILLSFFHQQGVSVQLLGYAERYEVDKYNDFSVFDLFRPIYQNIDMFYHKISGVNYNFSPSERMERYNNYSMIIANSTDSSKFDSGFGLGGSYLTESKLLLGFFGLIIVNIILGYILSRVEYLSGRSNYIYGIFFLILPDIIYLPRSYLFEFANTQMRPVLLLLIILFTINVLKKRS
ncbi:O-antigen polysaccharide polymerase Wzy [Vibrio cyclitrophicus]|nr:O-antigen polysaccharide polymerase Wzy [Vibrio cyclitrophicus]PMJ29682.1 hypothetical protein BCU25_18165 [Vibrio cyclitrophicus]